MSDEAPIREEDFVPPTRTPRKVKNGEWLPALNPTQQKAFEDSALYILLSGEKGSGKSVSGLQSLVRHCYEEDDALAFIMAPQIRTGKEGALYDLLWVLDQWKNGNWADREQTTRADDGLGLDFEYTDATLDPSTKDRILYIGNQHGGWSKVVLISIPYAEVVEARMKDLAPSFVYVSEITELGSKEFFTYVSQQLGRRRGIKGPQQYVASCNPEGPSHWVYEVWWVDCVNAETGERDKDYSVYHVPIEENRHNLPPGYIERLQKLYKDDTDRQRLLQGKWIDRPSGEAIFKNSWRQEFHVRGDHKSGTGLTPLPHLPVWLGWDPGPMNYVVQFMQLIPCKESTIWTVFDECNWVESGFSPDFIVVPAVEDKMKFWKDRAKLQAGFTHISDVSAFNQLRPNGTYDATRVRDLSEGRINLRPAFRVSQGKGTVPARVQMMQTMLMANRMFVSAQCPKTIEMFRLLASEKQKTGKYDENAGLKPKRSPYLHPFDATSYPPFFGEMNPYFVNLQVDTVKGGEGVYGARV